MSGYVSRRVTKSCKCTQCCVALHRNDGSTLTVDSLTMRKNRGGLIKPRSDVYDIIKTTDKHLRTIASSTSHPLKTMANVQADVQNMVIEELRNKVFKELEQHFLDQHLVDEDDHCVQLIKHISSLFIRTLMYHHGKLFTQRFVHQNKPSRRHELTKTYLFLGQ
ncbi:uncharacterized protein [Diadema setosum]|uniref:uncharacterized protein n=1 Tax=Diadema setosum TaxID=31175 RepID=UPI003B3BBFD3